MEDNNSILAIMPRTHEVDILSNDVFTATKTGLFIEGDISYDDWIGYGEVLRQINGAIQWCLGDWLCYGEHKYGDTYTQALDATDYEYQSLANMHYVARHIPFYRRRENLSWSHHSVVASLPDEIQSAMLDTAIENNLSVKDFREVVKQVGNGGLPKPPEVPETERLANVINALRGQIDKAMKLIKEEKYDEAWETLYDTRMITAQGDPDLPY